MNALQYRIVSVHRGETKKVRAEWKSIACGIGPVGQVILTFVRPVPRGKQRKVRVG